MNADTLGGEVENFLAAQQDLLFTIAEVAAAFAGFSTLVSAILRQHAANPSRVLSMLTLSVMVVLFALLPAIPPLFQVPEEAGWRGSSFALALGWLTYWALTLRLITGGRLGTSLSELPLLNRMNTLVVHPIGILLPIGGALGVWGANVGAVYAASLFLLLALAGFLFVQVALASFIPAKTEE